MEEISGSELLFCVSIEIRVDGFVGFFWFGVSRANLASLACMWLYLMEGACRLLSSLWCTLMS